MRNPAGASVQWQCPAGRLPRLPAGSAWEGLAGAWATALIADQPGSALHASATLPGAALLASASCNAPLKLWKRVLLKG